MLTSLAPLALGLRWNLKYPTTIAMAASRPVTSIATNTEEPDDGGISVFVTPNYEKEVVDKIIQMMYF